MTDDAASTTHIAFAVQLRTSEMYRTTVISIFITCACEQWELLQRTLNDGVIYVEDFAMPNCA